jgi:hypothetical protein
MLKPDLYFNKNADYFPAKDRKKARELFRRAVRDYYVMRRRFVIDPVTGGRVQRVLIGAIVKQEKKQRRIVKTYFTGKNSAGRPSRPEIKLLIARLFALWGLYAASHASFSWKTNTAKSTQFEEFLHDLLPRLGASDVKRYVEEHWRNRD